MSEYVVTLLGQRGRRTDMELTWELEAALDEKQSRGERFTALELLVWQLCTVSTCDGIGELLESNHENVNVAASFALERGLLKTAEILANAVKGIPVAGPVGLTATVLGKVVDVPLPFVKWGATDLTLSMLDENLDGAILDFVSEHVKDFIVVPPAEVAQNNKTASDIAALASQKKAVELFRELLAHEAPRIRASMSDDTDSGTASDFLEIPVRHWAQGPVKPKDIARLAAQYGSAAASLLEVYAAHNGAELFVAEDEAGFCLISFEDWPAHMRDVMRWATEVTWQDDAEEIPDYLESSIPFGYIPGDSERWLLVTRGENAGKVMLSDTDVIDDDPRFESIDEFFAALIINTRKVIGCGGYISCGTGERLGAYYPVQYLYQIASVG